MFFKKNKDEEFDESKINDQSLQKYEKDYSEGKLISKITKYGKSIGLSAVYKAAQLFYVLQKEDVPANIKVVILGALGYLISPLDFIPDLAPLIGYTDDVIAIGYALLQAQAYIDDKVKEQSKQLMVKIFGADVYDQLE